MAAGLRPGGQELLGALGTAHTMQQGLGILEACAFVMEAPRWVKINDAQVDALAQQWCDTPLQVPSWDWEIHWRGPVERMIHYVLLLDALNFCFWAVPETHAEVGPDGGRWQVEYRDRKYNGYKALSVALARALDEGVPVDSADYLADLTGEQLQHILRGEHAIPLFEERLKHARQVGQQLRDLYAGDFRNCLDQAGGSAVQLVQAIARDFPCFEDVSQYRGRRIPIYKRAQIAVVDLAGCLGFEGYGKFHDLGQLTAFADYKIPQVLRALKVLVYDEELAARVDQKVLLAPGSEEEVEIRAGMVWAVELLRRALAQRGRELQAYELDWFLWGAGQQAVADERPYHRTLTVCY